MKSILISIKPEWVAKILNGEKTIEIRKSAPKCELPIDVYIYCTKGEEKLIESFDLDDGPFFARNKEFFDNGNEYLNGKVLAKFTLKKIDDIGKFAYAFKDNFFYETLKNACLTTKDLTEYANVTRDKFERKGMKLYAWHISDLEIFDEPKKLSDFGLKRAPQSWCYVGEDD